VLTQAQAGQICEEFAGMLATIHGVDVSAVGLDGFGKPEGYMARQLARWQRQWDLSVTREMPGYAELVRRLAEGLPAEGGPVTLRAGGSAGTLVHGDFRIDNMLIRPEPEPVIAAVVDWEMSTLGDPLADLGLSLVYWIEPGEEDLLSRGAGESVTTGAGFLTRDQIAARYAELTGRDLSRLDYYMAFGCFKLAVVLEGIHARFLQHKTVGEGFERDGEAVATLIRRAHELLDANG
jgi:aminoglycoside phosphotransferase (APT) family kinase protein